MEYQKDLNAFIVLYQELEEKYYGEKLDDLDFSLDYLDANCWLNRFISSHKLNELVRIPRITMDVALEKLVNMERELSKLKAD